MPIRRKLDPRKRSAPFCGVPPRCLSIADVNCTTKAKEDASELLQKKEELEKEKKLVEELVLEKEIALQKRINIIGNYVHESVPLSNNEVSQS